MSAVVQSTNPVHQSSPPIVYSLLLIRTEDTLLQLESSVRFAPPNVRGWGINFIARSECKFPRAIIKHLYTAMDESAPASKPPGELYPPIEPYNSGFLTVSDIHEIFYAEYGNRDGNPIVYL